MACHGRHFIDGDDDEDDDEDDDDDDDDDGVDHGLDPISSTRESIWFLPPPQYLKVKMKLKKKQNKKRKQIVVLLLSMERGRAGCVGVARSAFVLSRGLFFYAWPREGRVCVCVLVCVCVCYESPLCDDYRRPVDSRLEGKWMRAFFPCFPYLFASASLLDFRWIFLWIFVFLFSFFNGVLFLSLSLSLSFSFSFSFF